MKILALIPARAGSKRIPNKNIRNLGGQPLINWTIEAATGIPEIIDCLVSTDSPKIAEIARNAGALVPWLRPSELATDIASTIDVCLHAANWYEQEKGKIDCLLLLQPTSPFRNKLTIIRAIEKFKNDKNTQIISVSPTQFNPSWCFTLVNERLEPLIKSEKMHTRSQDCPSAYEINGSIYISDLENLRKHRTFLTPKTIALIVNDKRESLDIDTEDDWSYAEFLLMRETGNQYTE